MSIEKMVVVNLNGSIDKVDVAMLNCCKIKAFHPEKVANFKEYIKEYDTDINDETDFLNKEIDEIAQKFNIKQEIIQKEEVVASKEENVEQLISSFLKSNRYADLYQKMQAIGEMCKCKLKYKYSTSFNLETSKLEKQIIDIYSEMSSLFKEKKDLEQKKDELSQIISQLSHLSGMNILLDELFACKMFKVRFGFMPHESYLKLKYYEDKPFVCFSYDSDSRYDWCLYMVPRGVHKETDNIFKALYFQRIIVPDYDKSKNFTAQTVLKDTEEELKKIIIRIKEKEEKISKLADINKKFLNNAYSYTKFLKKCLDLKQNVLVLKDKFYLVGFLPKQRINEFVRLFEGSQINITIKDAADEEHLQVPVKLKNNKLFKSFEPLIEMYGTPNYDGIDPTKFFAIVYMLLFGIMFGDLGQGMVISLIGFLLFKLKGMDLGKVMMQVGVSSSLFGFLYCSFFGNEEILIPWHQKLFGTSGALIEIKSSEMTMKMLFLTVIAGAVLIITSILISILVNIKRRNWIELFFSQKCIMGFLFYCSLIIYVISKITSLNINVKLLLWLGIILPLICIFAKEFISNSVKEKKIIVKDAGNYILLNLFELLEIVLSFVSNTFSFMRVGGFILSHSGLMLTVSIISQMFPNSNIFIVILGNALVIALEGFIVGVQILRLEFYELFSRFFDGGGKQFKPFGLELEK